MWQKDFAGVIKDLEMGRSSWTSEWVPCNHGVLISEEREAGGSEKQMWGQKHSQGHSQRRDSC